MGACISPVHDPWQVPTLPASTSCARQDVAAEAVALEERLLQARSRELMVGREAGIDKAEARRAAAHASAAASERASLQDTIDMLQVTRTEPR